MITIRPGDLELTSTQQHNPQEGLGMIKICLGDLELTSKQQQTHQ